MLMLITILYVIINLRPSLINFFREMCMSYFLNLSFTFEFLKVINISTELGQGFILMALLQSTSLQFYSICFYVAQEMLTRWRFTCKKAKLFQFRPV